MSFTTPTIDVYVPGTTLGIGNVNASIINIGQNGTTVNVGGTMAVTNSFTTPSCTVSSLTTGNLLISPFSGNVAFNNFSALTATITNASMTNASFNTLNSSNILIGPYPINGTFTNINLINASITNVSSTNMSVSNMSILNTLNVSNLLITPLSNNPTFTNINTTTINCTDLITAGGITMGTGKNITLSSGTVAPTSTQLGYLKAGTVKASSTVINSGANEIGSITLDAGSWIINAYCNINPVSITTDNVGVRYSINTVSAVLSTTYLLMGSEGVTYSAISTAPTLAGTAMVSITTTTTYYLNLQINLISGSATVGTVTRWNAMRIG